MTCAACGQALPQDARFCPSCGTPVDASLEIQERKVVTVLFADLVDSTGLAQRLDPELAREVLSRFYDAVSEEIRALRGVPERFSGDAVMAVFGLPHVHEDDGVRAVRAGVAIVARLHRLTLELGLGEPLRARVGLESGEAATGFGPSGQPLVTGAVVNAAARLQVAAEPDEVLAGETAQALTEASVSFGDRRVVVAKGFEGGLAAFPVEGLTARSVRRTIPIVGRDFEMSILRDGFARVLATQRPLLITVFGESGIGKSRLADEFMSGLADDAMALVGRSHPATDGATFAPVAGMVRDIAGIEHDDPAPKALRRLQELAERWDEGPDQQRMVDRLALLLGLSEPGREESAYVQDAQAGVLSLVEKLAADGPVVLLFDDVQGLRAPMLDLIERIAARSHRGLGQALVMAITRSELLEERRGWGSGAVNHVMLHLEPLGAQDALALVRQASGGRIDGAEAEALANRAGGNPFFIVESTGALLAGGSTGTSLPPTVQAVVASRLDALPDAERDLARRLSVFADSFDVEDVRLVSESGVEQLGALEDAEIVVREEGPPGSKPQWRMRHETLREVAYASLPKRQRLQLHLANAEAMLANDNLSCAADHLERAAQASLDVSPSDRAVAERAADVLARAGDRARRRMVSRTAIDYYERALALNPDESSWGTREARMLAGIGEARYWLAEYQAAAEVLQRAVDLGTAQNDDWTLAMALRFLGDIAINFEADMEKAEDLLRRSLKAAESLDEPWAIARTLLFAGWVPWTRDQYDQAEPMWQRALSLAQEHGDQWAEVRALTNLSINHESMDDIEVAKEYIDRAEKNAEAMGDQFSVAVTTTQRGRLYEDVGRFEEALACFQSATDSFADLGARWEQADALAERGITNRELGRLDEAEHDLHQAIRMSEELGERQMGAWTWRALARVAERRGDEAEAQRRFRRAEEEDSRRPK